MSQCHFRAEGANLVPYLWNYRRQITSPEIKYSGYRVCRRTRPSAWHVALCGIVSDKAAWSTNCIKVGNMGLCSVLLLLVLYFTMDLHENVTFWKFVKYINSWYGILALVGTTIGEIQGHHGGMPTIHKPPFWRPHLTDNAVQNYWMMH